MTKIYRGNIQAVILDWAGTTVDYGCFAPVDVFIKVFQGRGVSITIAQARGPMGLEKRDHIRTVSQLPEVAVEWERVHHQSCSEADIDGMYRDSLSLQKDSVITYANIIPGALETAAYLRECGIKIGSTTGYSQIIMDELRPIAAEKGYAPDELVCPNEVPVGRPAPYMIYSNALQLGVYPMAAIVKVGDTLPDIEEGLNAGTWVIGLSQTGNELGLSQAEAEALSESELSERLAPIETCMKQAGAHAVICSIADLPAALEAIEARLRADEQP